MSEPTPRDRRYTLIGILLALFLGAIDQTIVATALPEIASDLQGLSRYAWVATAYLLASTVLVPIYGKLADMYSRKHIELFSVGVFLAGSFLCGISGELGTLPLLGDGMSQLIVFRAIQGLGGAGLFSMAFIIIADLFPPRVRGRYQGLVGATFGVASVLGPWLGGLLTDHAGGIVPGVEGWRWVFYVNVPFGALALWFIITRMPKLEPHGERKPLDLVSATFLVLALVPLVLALQLDKAIHPWGGAVTLGAFAVSGTFLTAFVVRSLRSANPILDLRLFENRVFSTANLALFFLGAVFLCAVIFLPLFLVQVLGVSATRAGLSLIPLSLGTVFGAIVSGQLVSLSGRYRPLMLIGTAILGVGIWLLSSMTQETSYLTITLYMIVVGLGVGPSLPLYTLAIQNAVDVRKVGQATSASQFFRQIGGTVGAAIMGTVLAGSLAGAFGGVADGAGAPTFPLDAGMIESLQSGADPAQLIRQSFDAQAATLAAAIQSDDPEALQLALQESPVPEAAHPFILAGAARARGDADATDAFLAQLRGRFDVQAEELSDTVTQALKSGTTEAIQTIYGSLLYVVVVGMLATLFIPALELRTTNDAVVAAAGTGKA